MRKRLWHTIHQMDLRIDNLKDPLLLTLATGIREGLMDMLKDHAAGLACEEWEKTCLSMLNDDFTERPNREKILHFLKISEGPDTSLCEDIDIESPKKLRILCEMQRDRICFFQAMKPLRTDMIHQLPEAERTEEEQLAAMREMMLNEQFNNLLMLYMKASFMKQNHSHTDRFRLSLRDEIPEERKKELTEKTAQILINREHLQNSRKDFENSFSEQRIFGDIPVSLICKDTERRMETNANQRTPAEKKECRNQEGNQEPAAFQSAHPQHGIQREKNAPGDRLHETESD